MIYYGEFIIFLYELFEIKKSKKYANKTSLKVKINCKK